MLFDLCLERLLSGMYTSSASSSSSGDSSKTGLLGVVFGRLLCVGLLDRLRVGRGSSSSSYTGFAEKKYLSLAQKSHLFLPSNGSTRFTK